MYSNYQETVQWMYEKLPIFQKSGEKALRYKLTNIRLLLKHLKNPHKKIKCVHIAGTNGKGSINHYLASVYIQQGYSVGQYTSPHLQDFRERIKINGILCSQRNVVDFIENNKDFIEENNFSFFEITTAMAFEYFCKMKVDVAIIETGLGGRLDSTNVIKPILSIISSIHFDHKYILGNTLEEIAYEKGGIIKKDTPLIIGNIDKKPQKTLLDIAKNKNASCQIYKEVKIPEIEMLPNFQKHNVSIVSMAIESLKNTFPVNQENLKSGIKNIVQNTNLIGRWQTVCFSPKTILDVGHNMQGVNTWKTNLKTEKYDNLHLFFSTTKDRDFLEIYKALPNCKKIYLVQTSNSRNLTADEYIDICTKHLESKYKNLEIETHKSISDALNSAKNQVKKNDICLIGGSFFLIGDLLEKYSKKLSEKESIFE